MRYSIQVDRSQLLDYAYAGRVTFARLSGAMRHVANKGRTTARQLIRSQFKKRTGRLNQDARKINIKATAKAAIVSAVVGPMPRLLNIFEKGATIKAHTQKLRKATAWKMAAGVSWQSAGFAKGQLFVGGHTLAPRPVMGPSLKAMELEALMRVNEVMAETGQLKR